MRITDPNRGNDIGKFFLHTNQLLPKQSCRKLETMKIIGVNPEFETTTTFAVQANKILELCIAKYWSNHGQSHLKYSLEFHGVAAQNPNACKYENEFQYLPFLTWKHFRCYACGSRHT